MSRAPKNQHRELTELAALFAAAGLTDLFTDVLGHRIGGPSILIALGVGVAAVTFARHLPVRRARAASVSVPASATTSAPAGTTATVTSTVASALLPEPAGGASVPSGRLWRVRTLVEDAPGRLAVLAGAFAAVGANILTLQVHPAAEGVVDEFLVRAATGVAPNHLATAVASAGGGQVHVEAADVTDLADVPTRALALARHLAGGPDHLGRVLAELLAATDVTWRPSGDATAPAGDDRSSAIDGSGLDESGGGSIEIALNGPARGVMVLSRAHMPFTLVEFARAQAMADLAAAMYRLDASLCSCS